MDERVHKGKQNRQTHDDSHDNKLTHISQECGINICYRHKYLIFKSVGSTSLTNINISLVGDLI